MTVSMPALTIWQPWATLIAEEAKPYEFRGYPAARRYQGQRIAIHAGARPVKVTEVRALLVKLHSDAWRHQGLCRSRAIEILERVKADPTILPLSSILCTAVLGTPMPPGAIAQRLGMEPVNDSDRDQHFNFAWPLTDVQRLQPIVPASGKQGFWSVTLPQESSTCP